MKKTLALLICLVMLFTALSVNVFAAETEPTIEIVTNSISEGKTTFAVKVINQGDPVKGVDITVNVTGDAKITDVSAKNFKDVTDTLTDGEDYKISENKKSLHAVGLQKDTNTGEIISVTATATTDFDISVDCDIATSSTNKVTKSDTAQVTAATPIKKDVTTDTVSQPSENYFIPYGSVYKVKGDGKYEYANKGTEGTFNGTNGMTATQFKVPDNGLGTFGISESMKKSVNPSKQFGNYTNTYSPDNKYGTMIIVGDWVGFKDWYLANKGYSDAVLFEKVYTAYKTAMEKPEAVDADYVRLTAGGKEIHVYDVLQTKVMWQSGSVLEYAVRVINNFNVEKSYSASAYCIKADKTLVLSQDILTTKIGVTQQ